MNKKTLIIIIALIAAVVIAAVALLAVNPTFQTLEGENYKATCKGDGNRTVTVTVKGSLPEGGFWHVQDNESGPLNFEVKKSTGSMITVSITGAKEGSGHIAVFADNSEEMVDKLNVTHGPVRNEDGSVSLDEKGELIMKDGTAAGFAEPGPDYETYLNLFITVNSDEKNTLHIEEFYMGEELEEKPIVEDKTFSAYYSISEGRSVITIPDADTGWKVQEITGAGVNVEEPSWDSDGNLSFAMFFATEGKSVVTFANSRFMKAFSVNVESGYLNEDDKSLGTYVYVTGAETVVLDTLTEDAAELLDKASQVSGDLSLPEGAVITDCVTYEYQKGNQNTGEGNDIADCTLNYDGEEYSYSFSDKVSMKDLSEDLKKLVKDGKAEEQKTDIDGKEVFFYLYQGGEDSEGSFAALWEEKGSVFMLSGEGTDTEKAADFISKSAPVSVPEKTPSADSSSDNPQDKNGTRQELDTKPALDILEQVQNGQKQ